MLASARTLSASTSSSIIESASSAQMRMSYRAAYGGLRAPAGFGLGITYVSRDVGPLVPPPAPRLASSEVLPELNVAHPGPASVEAQVLSAMPTSSLYVRRQQKRKSMKSALSQSPNTAVFHPGQVPTVHMPPMMALLLALSVSDADPLAEEPEEEEIPEEQRVGLGLSGVQFSSSSFDEFGNEVVFTENGEWQYVKAKAFKSCKDRVCTPHAVLTRNNSWL